MASSIKVWILLLVLTAVTACQPARDQRQSIRLGRTRAGTNYNANQTQGTTTGIDNKVWGTIYSSNSGQWNQAVQAFASPSLGGLATEDQALGTVSSNQADSTGIRFYGNVSTTGGTSNNHPVDGSSAYLHVEIFDSNTGKPRSDGTLRSPVIIDIDPQLDGKGSGQILGNLQSSSSQTVNLHFEDAYGGIDMDGTLSGNSFSGTISFCNLSQSPSCAYHSTGMQALGNFSVEACGFFNCY